MIITRLVKKGKNVIVEVDGNDEFLVMEEVVYKAGLRKHDEITEEQLNGFIAQSSLIKIKEKAFDLLSRRAHSARELKNKLLKKGFEAYQINPVIEELSRKGYLNDEEFAKLLAEEKIVKRKKGLNLVRKVLYEKGIDRHIIDKTLAAYSGSEILFENAVAIAEKKIKSLKHKNYNNIKLKNKIQLFLSSRGYPGELIAKVIQELFNSTGQIESEE